MRKHNQILLVYLILTAASLIAFWQLNRCDFINYDDPAYVTENIHIRHGITTEAIRWAFTVGYASNWHPLTWMSHMLDVQLFGLNPRWHHLTNLLFHIANTLLLFFIFHRMTKAPWKSAFVAALFAIHPLHVESVAWVAERKDVLSTFFWMLTMAAYINYVEHRAEDGERKTEDGKRQTENVGYTSSLLCSPSSVLRYSAVLIFFALGLMAKPMLVTLPFVLLLLDYWPLQRLGPHPGPHPKGEGDGKPDLPASSKKKKRGKSAQKHTSQGTPALTPTLSQRERENRLEAAGTPAAPLCLSGSRGRTVVEVGAPSEFSPSPSRGRAGVRALLWEKVPLFVLAALSCILTYVAQQKGGAVASFEGIPLGARIANALVSYIIYIGKTVWPNNLAVFYPHPGSRPLWQTLGAVFILGAVTLTVIRTAKRFPYLAMGWLWFAGTLVPVIGIVQVGAQAMADRYTYIPLIGLFVMAAWGIPELLKKWQPARPPRKEALFASSALILACFSIVTWRQVRYWNSSIALYDHALSVTGQNDTILVLQGTAHGQLGNLRQAIPDFDKAIEINPENAEAYYNRGVAYGQLGNFRQAIENYNRTIELNPRYVRAYYNRGAAYAELGLDSQGIEDLKTAAKLDCDEAKNFLTSRGISW